MCDFLIQRGCPINAKDKKNMTALAWAKKHNRLATIKFLEEKGANLGGNEG